MQRAQMSWYRRVKHKVCTRQNKPTKNKWRYSGTLATTMTLPCYTLVMSSFSLYQGSKIKECKEPSCYFVIRGFCPISDLWTMRFHCSIHIDQFRRCIQIGNGCFLRMNIDSIQITWCAINWVWVGPIRDILSRIGVKAIFVKLSCPKCS